LAKLKGCFANIHVADNHPSNSQHVSIGDGSIDWREFLLTLHQSGFTGYWGLDLGLTGALVDGYHTSVKAVESIGEDLGIPLEV
jgi:sugar phosphate isomerase/epimerase